MRRRRDERGSAAVFVLGMSVVLMACAGLVIDGGLAINARMRVADHAEQAARLAADSIDVAALREDGVVTVDLALAQSRAQDYLIDQGYSPDQIDITPDETTGNLRIRVEDVSDTKILSIIKVKPFDVSAVAVAEPRTE